MPTAPCTNSRRPNVRILDRYLVREFGLPLLYCLDAFAMLWIVMDLFGTLDDFIEHQVGLWQVVRYYVIVFPEALVQIIPMALLLGCLFCLSNLGKHNELLAMRAGGVSLARIALPFFLTGLLASGVVLVINVWFVPGAHEHANAVMRSLRGKGEEHLIENLFYTSKDTRRDWYARRFNAATEIFDNPEIHERDESGKPSRDIYAEQARWLEGAWVFYAADIYDHSRGPHPAIEHVAVTNFPGIDDKPRQLLAENKRPDEMSSRELRRVIRAMRATNRRSRLAELEVTLQHRFAFPLTCFMVVWMGVPLGLTVSRSGALRSVGLALIMVVAFHFSTNIALALGSGNHLPPIVAAWGVNVVFAVMGGWLLLRAR